MAAVAAFVVVGINIFLAVNYLLNVPNIGTASLAVAGAAIAIYILFCVYLVLDMAVHMGVKIRIWVCTSRVQRQGDDINM